MASFKTGEEWVSLCEAEKISLAEAVIRYEIEKSETPREEIVQKMKEAWKVSVESVHYGLNKDLKSVGGMIGGNAHRVLSQLKTKLAFGGPLLTKAMAYALAVSETNASMGRILAAPTAGASGVIPGSFLALAEECSLEDDVILDGLFTSSGTGLLIATNATIAGSMAGCQAEVGSASSMAASAIVAMMGGSPQQSLDAASIALKNLLGMVCDPVAGLVEVPCSSRNAMGVANAIVSSQMVLCGVKSVIPFDEVVVAMAEIGRLMPKCLRETAKGGLANTPTAKNIEKRIFGGIHIQ